MLKLLDLYCGAGGAAMGYYNAGFKDITGVDIAPQPRYPFRFIQADAMKFPLDGYDAIHASPPCQKYTRMNQGLLQAQGRAKKYPDLLGRTRRRIIKSGKPYVIENVPGAPLKDPVLLCGSMFNLMVRRHRLFECSFFTMTMQCQHHNQNYDCPPLHRFQGKSSVVGCYGNGRGAGDTVGLWQKAMGITWMIRKELSQAIPPAYTEWIGKQMMKIISNQI